MEFFADPLGGLADEDWDNLAAGRFYSSAFWLRLVALEPGAATGAVHAALPGGGLVAMPAAVVEDADKQSNPHLRWPQLLAERGLPSPPAQGLLIGQRRGYLAHILSTPGTDPVAAAGALVQAVRSVSLAGDGDGDGDGDGGARVALYLTTPDVLALRAAGVSTMPVALSADAWIEIEPGDFDAWLATRSRKTRTRVRKEEQAFKDAGYRIEHRTLAESYMDVGRLTARTEQRYGIQADPDDYREAFRRHAELAGDRAEVLLCAVGDEPPVGCLLYMREGDTVYLRAVGFEYEQLRGVGEYFNLTYYAPARFPGVRHLHAGIATPEGKALRGAELRALWLLDLSQDSPLLGRDAEVLAHNHAFRAELAALSPAVEAALVGPDWDPFCRINTL